MQLALLGLLLAAACVADRGPGAPLGDDLGGDRDAWWHRLRWDTATCPREPIGRDQSGVHIHGLAGGYRLIEINCFLGAYQGQSLLYLESPGGQHPTLLSFDQFESPDRGLLEHYRSAELVGTLDVDASTRQLTVLRRYRGIGDCGQLLTYELSDSDAELLELRHQNCDDGAVLAPQSWPRLPLDGLRQEAVGQPPGS